MLGDLLNQHGSIRWHGEIFFGCEGHAHAGAHFDRIMESVLRRSVPRIGGYEIKGLACQHPAVMQRDLPQLLEAMRGYGLRKAIHLQRRNILLKLVSTAIVREKLVDGWHLSAPDRGMREAKLRLDLGRVEIFGRTAPLLDQIDYVERGYRESLALLSQRFPTLSLVYEDDIETDPAQAFRKVVAFLGLPPQAVSTNLRKTNVRALPDLLENFAEVRRALAGTRHEWMTEAG